MNELAFDLEEKVAAVAPEKRHILLCGGIPCRSLRCREVKEAGQAELRCTGTVPKVHQGRFLMHCRGCPGKELFSFI